MNKRMSEEHKRKISEALRGRKHTKETKIKLSEVFKGKNHPNYGKHCSEETKKKISDGQKNKINISIEELIESYKELQSTRKVAKKYNIGQTTVRRKLARSNIINKPIRHSCDDDFFSRDTCKSFYWAGFLAADGCVQNRNNVSKIVRLGLAKTDKGHIKKFNEVIKFTGPIYDSICNGGSEVTINSPKMFSDLERFNIVPRKSLIYTFPDWLTEHKYVSHFMRGYFDGDGGIYIKSGKTSDCPQAKFCVFGQKDFLYSYKYVLENVCDISKMSQNGTTRIRKEKENLYSLIYCGNIMFSKIRKFLYNSSRSNTRLDRKYDKSFSIKLKH